jgi:hypothetical protein
MKRRATTMALLPSVVDSIDAFARGENLSRSQVVERALVEFLGRQKMVAGVFRNDTVTAAFLKAFSEPGVMKQMAAAMQEEVSDEQMELFQRAVREATAGVKAVHVQQAKRTKKKQST